jgi:hypothetical protein
MYKFRLMLIHVKGQFILGLIEVLHMQMLIEV